MTEPLLIAFDPAGILEVRVPPWWAIRAFGVRERWLRDHPIPIVVVIPPRPDL